MVIRGKQTKLRQNIFLKAIIETQIFTIFSVYLMFYQNSLWETDKVSSTSQK